MDAPDDPQHAAPPALSIRGLVCRFEDRVAVDRLDVDLAPGEILGLVGPNGAGKTTTLRSVAGVLPVREGRIEVDGHDVTRDAVRAKSRLAYVPDDPAPFDVLTVDEHLEFTARLHGLAENGDGGWRARAEELLATFELLDRRDAIGSELSRGMRQKLAFCCAWLPEPALLLLDEPLSGLDPRGIRAARAAIEAQRARGAAVVLSSHLLELIEALATRILILDGGKAVFDGTLAGARAATSLSESDSLETIFFAATGGDGAVTPARADNQEPPE